MILGPFPSTSQYYLQDRFAGGGEEDPVSDTSVLRDVNNLSGSL